MRRYPLEKEQICKLHGLWLVDIATGKNIPCAECERERPVSSLVGALDKETARLRAASEGKV